MDQLVTRDIYDAVHGEVVQACAPLQSPPSNIGTFSVCQLSPVCASAVLEVNILVHLLLTVDALDQQPVIF
jgi:hypothetical protein